MKTKKKQSPVHYQVWSHLCAPVNDITKAITPELNIDIESDLILVKLNHSNRLGEINLW